MTLRKLITAAMNRAGEPDENIKRAICDCERDYPTVIDLTLNDDEHIFIEFLLTKKALAKHRAQATARNK